MIPRIIFAVDGTPFTGFGHIGRCLAILRAMRSQSGRHFPAVFWGEFSEAAATRIRQACPDAVILPQGQRPSTSAFGLYDTMTDSERPELFDMQRLDTLMHAAQRVVFIASGTAVPKLPSDVRCVGYQPGLADMWGPDVYWGMRFAPVESTATQSNARAEPRRLLIAFGAGLRPDAVEKTLHAAAICDDIGPVDLLLSPLAPALDPHVSERLTGRLTVYRAVPSVVPLLQAATLVVTSYGNLGFEALAQRCGVLFLAQKQFQQDYADNLVALGCAMSGGHAERIEVSQLAALLGSAMKRAADMGRIGAQLVDCHGIDRIAQICLADMQIADEAQP